MLNKHALAPTRATPGSAGYDLSSCHVEDVTIPPRSRRLIETGVAVDLPGTFVYGRLLGRSGLAARASIDVAAGVIDSDYSGPISVVLVNNSDVEFTVTYGDRIAQLVVEYILVPDAVTIVPYKMEGFSYNSVVAEGAEQRGTGAFGSTGGVSSFVAVGEVEEKPHVAEVIPAAPSKRKKTSSASKSKRAKKNLDKALTECVKMNESIVDQE